MRIILNKVVGTMTHVAQIFLSSLEAGQEATVVAVHAEEALHHRLAALGFRIGKPLRLMRRGAFFGPLHVRIGSTDVIIRRRDASTIEVAAEVAS